MRLLSSKKWLRVVVTVLLGLGASRTYAAIPKDVLVAGETLENCKNFDPAVVFELPCTGFARNLYTALVKLTMDDGKFSIRPDAAEKWEVSPDGKTWTFQLRKNGVFENGDPLRSADVVYSLKRTIKMAKPPAWLFTQILGLTEESITAPDDFTVKVVTKGVPPNVALSILGNTLASIVDSKVVKEHEVNGDMGAAWLMDHSTGAGAYSIKEWKRKEALVFTANKKYWAGEPKIKTIIFKDIPEAADRLLQVKKGDLDVAFHLVPDQIKGIESSPGNLKIVSTPGQSNEYVAVNANWGPFKDVRVRQAVKYALDYDAIINQAVQGAGILNQQFLAIGYFGYEEKNPFKLNLDKAKALMKEAGQGSGFEVELVTNTREDRRIEAQIVQENLAKIGIKVTINVMQAAQMYQKMREQGINLIVAGWGIDYPDADALATPFANHKAKQLAWRMGWLDDKAAGMVEAAAKEMDEKARLKIYRELTEYFQQNGPFAMLYQYIERWAVNKEVKGLEQAFAGFALNVDFTKISK